MKLVAITPRLPPAIDGVGDYAFILAQELRSAFQIQTQFIVAQSQPNHGVEKDGFQVTQIPTHSAKNLLSCLPADDDATVLLHYVNYGFAKRGCPVWLVEGLSQWRSHRITRKLITMFHEISASGPFWTSSFWLSKYQRNLAKQIAQLSDSIMTSKELYADILLDISDGKHKQVPSLPIFSNIGDIKNPQPLSMRQRNLVIFGGSASRRRVYQQSYRILCQACSDLNIQQILDIGPPIGLKTPLVNGMPVITLGVLSEKKISKILANSMAGYIDYHPDFLAKSGIFAAYCSHGLLPVNVLEGSACVDGLLANQHYWCPNVKASEKPRMEVMQRIASSAFAWYQTHRVSVHAEMFSQRLAML